MAKAIRSTTRVAKKFQTNIVQQAKQAVQELRDFYQLGHVVREADQNNPRKGAYNLGVSVEIATKIGKTRDFVDKARKFAESYTEAEFEELCSLRRPDGMPLGSRHVIGLLRIKNKRRRKQFQRKAALNGWPTRQIAAEVSKLLGTGGSGGRQAKAPADVDEALAQIITMSNRWGRWYEGFNPKKRKEKDLEKFRIEVDDLPESVRKQLGSVTRQIRKLKAAVEEELKPST